MNKCHLGNLSICKARCIFALYYSINNIFFDIVFFCSCSASCLIHRLDQKQTYSCFQQRLLPFKEHPHCECNWSNCYNCKVQNMSFQKKSTNSTFLNTQFFYNCTLLHFSQVWILQHKSAHYPRSLHQVLYYCNFRLKISKFL